MRNKNTIIFLLIVFVGICAYNLYWTYVQFQSDQRIEEVTSNLNRLKAEKPDASNWSAADSAIEKEYNSVLRDSTFMNRRKRAVERSFTLGLDLQGGMFVTLEVGVEELVRQMASNPNDSSVLRAIACAQERQTAQAQAFVPLFVACFEELNPNESLGVAFSNEDLDINVSSTNAEVAEILVTEEESAIDRTFNIIRTRITQFGVVSPNLQKQESTGRILLELPGVKEPERVRKILQSTAQLEFYECQPWSAAYPVLTAINAKLRQEAGIDLETNDTTEVETAATDEETAEDDEEGETVSLSPDDSTADDFSTTDDLLSQDADSTGEELSTEELQEKFRRENPLFALLTPMDYEGLSQIGSTTPNVGVVLANDTANMRLLNEIFAREDIQALIPDKMRFAWTFKPKSQRQDGAGAQYYELITLFDDGEPAMSGDQVSVARQDFDPTSGDPVVSMNMTVEGAKTWGLITERNVGKHVAILLDGLVYSYPVVNEAITGGRSQISGGFEIDEAKDLANVLKAGQLPVPASIEGEETVGPTLGAENVNSGLNSFLLAFIVILIFMGIYYSKAGLVANVALIANLIFFLGCAAAFTIVLTMPGMAAVVLTVGMAVDANVLIFERIREEMAKDKTLKASIKAGFSNAFSSVMDANITTFLTGVVLYAVGIGPIRGFAVSLMIGIITSLISALIITRLVLDYYANKGKDSITFGFPFTTGLFDRVKLNMVGRRKTFYMISGVIVVVSLISMFTIGFKSGVDFQGGRQFVVEFLESDGSPSPLAQSDVGQIREDLSSKFEGENPIVKTLKFDHQLMITSSYLVTDRQATGQVTELLIDGLETSYGSKTINVLSTSDVGPTVANDIREAANYAVIFSLMIIFFYILMRFRKWQYSLGAIAAIFHDVIIVLGIFSLLSQFDLGFSLEVNQPLIAALLTIIGYSINDTVVVFDRIRENLGEMRASKISDIYNISIDQTISRTLITSVTTFLTALTIFLFGGDGIRGFIFAIMIGIIVGTYSSVFVASPISLDLLLRQSPELDQEQEQTKGKGKSKKKKSSKKKSKA
ncbi:MAG: protein translocase subunit SecDF [Bacteroidota bacterium]